MRGVAGVGVVRGRPSAIDQAVRTLAADSIKTLRFTASGATFSVGQNFTPADPWPRVTLTHYAALIDFDTASMRQEFIREIGAMMPRLLNMCTLHVLAFH